MAKKCPPGKYYCFDEKKCKKIPRGYYIGARGFLAREKESDDSESSKKNGGNGNGDGNGGNGNGGSNGGGGNGGGNGGGGMGEEVTYEGFKLSKDIMNKNPNLDPTKPRDYMKLKQLQRQANMPVKKIDEAKMTEKQKRKDTMLKKKYDKSDMKKSMQKQYGKEEGKKVYFATIRKQAMEEESNPRIPRKKGQPAKSKKHSDLYTDEDPKGTIHGLGFKDVATSKASVSKIRNSSRSHAHKIQAAVAMEQRAREMGKTAEAAVYRKYINSMKKKTKKMNEDVVNEEGLRDWFGKSSGTTKSGRKVRGWVQVGGKYDGKPCARQPGQKSTPKCVSSAKRRSMSKDERDSAARRKRKADPNQPQKSGAAKPTNVSTDPKKKMKKEEYTIENIFKGTKGDGYLGKTSIPNPIRVTKDVVDTVNRQTKKRVDAVNKISPGSGSVNVPKPFNKKVSPATTRYLGIKNEETVKEAKDKKGKGSGTKDACYHKVKARYDVWPSAYASGALVKCRKVGAANWGNKSKNEGFTPMQIRALEAAGMIVEKKGQKCWPGYEKKGTKIMFGKRYNNCVKKKKTRKEEVELEGFKGYADLSKVEPESNKKRREKEFEKSMSKSYREQMKKKEKEVKEEKIRINKSGHTYKVVLTWRGKTYMLQMFIPSASRPTRLEIEQEVQKIYPDAKVMSFLPKGLEPGEPTMMVPEEYVEEKHYGSSVNKIPAELDKAVALHKSQAARLRKSKEFKDDAGKAANAIPAQLDKAVAMHQKQAKTLRAAGVSESNVVNFLERAKVSASKKLHEDDMKGMSVKSGHKRPTEKGAGMTAKGVAAYRRRNPGSKLKTAVTGKVKKGSKDAKRRKSYCARSAGQMKKFPKAAKDPNSRLRQARRRWKC